MKQNKIIVKSSVFCIRKASKFLPLIYCRNRRPDSQLQSGPFGLPRLPKVVGQWLHLAIWYYSGRWELSAGTNLPVCNKQERVWLGCCFISWILSWQNGPLRTIASWCKIDHPYDLHLQGRESRCCNQLLADPSTAENLTYNAFELSNQKVWVGINP